MTTEMIQTTTVSELERILLDTLKANFPQSLSIPNGESEKVYRISQRGVILPFNIANYRFNLNEREEDYLIMGEFSYTSLLFKSIANKKFKKMLRELHANIKKVNIPGIRSDSYGENAPISGGYRATLYLPKAA